MQTGACRLILLPLVIASLTLDFQFASGREDESRQLAYRELVARLASPNRPAMIGARKRLQSFPDNYDWDAQKEIASVRLKLYEGGEDAFRAMIRSVDDDRYCGTLLFEEDRYTNASVGTVCISACADMVEVYRRPVANELMFRKIYQEFAYTPEGIKDWWQLHSSQRLSEIQKSAIKDAIVRAKTGRQDNPDNAVRYDRTIQKLEDLERQLTQTGQLILVRPWLNMLTRPPR